MRKYILPLWILLALQSVLVIALLAQQYRGAHPGDKAARLASGLDAANRILIEDAEQHQVRLQRADGRWMLESYHGLPASESKVQDVLQRLQSAGAEWPVASTSGSQERFEVSAEKFQRQLVFRKDDQVLAELYLGTSPGFRKVHARAGDRAEIYAIPFSNHEASVQGKDWLDTGLLQLPAEWQSIQGGDFVLLKDGEALRLQGLSEGEEIHAEHARQLVSQLQALQVLEVAEEGDKIKTEGAAFGLRVQVNGQLHTLDFYQQGEQAFVATSRYPQVFRLAKYTLETLQGVQRASLVRASQAQADAPASLSAPAPTPIP